MFNQIHNHLIIKIIGLGNLIAGNDGIGIKIIQKLNKIKNNNKYLKNIEILDLGTCGLDILIFLENVDYVIFIDAIMSNNKIGSIMKISGKEFMENKSDINLFSLHDLGLKDVLLIGKEIQKMPQILIYGITINSKNDKYEQINYKNNNYNIIDLTLNIQTEL